MYDAHRAGWSCGRTLLSMCVLQHADRMPCLQHALVGSRRCAVRALQSSDGWQYGDALILTQCEQMPVSGDDEISFGGKRTGEHVIVVGIGEDGGRDRGGMYDGDETQVALHELRQGEAGSGDGLRKSGISQDLLEFGQQDWAGEEASGRAPARAVS